MRIAIVEFPGSSGAKDIGYVYSKILGQEIYYVWHQEDSLKNPDAVVVPGGAAFGDYLRPGALAKESPVLAPLRKFTADGGPVLGVGNGFQILCEAELLPGVLLVNPDLSYQSSFVHLLVEDTRSPFLKNLKTEELIKLPLSCYYGRYWADKRTIRDLEEGGYVVFRYCDAEGDVDLLNPFLNSLNSIAGITNRHGNVFGLMPHPERAAEELMGSTEGLKILTAILG